MAKFNNIFTVKRIGSTDTPIDIYDRWGVIVTEMKGINEKAEAKEPFKRDWIEKNGVDVYIPISGQTFKDKTIEMNIFSEINSSLLDEFMDYIMPLPILYYDDYRGKSFQLIYKSQSIEKDVHMDENYYSYGKIVFNCPKGMEE